MDTLARERSPMRTLYLCYFGLREPLVQTQVLPYLRGLAMAGIGVSLLTFEARTGADLSEEEQAKTRGELAAEGIRWFSLPYHKTPPFAGTAYDTLAGARFAVQLAKREGINVLHARAHVPAAMALGAMRFVNVKLVFDLRGLWAEEYADAGIWTEKSVGFRAIKSVERAALRRADQVIVLTKRMRERLIDSGLSKPASIEVIPCCVDFSQFNAVMKTRSRGDRFEVVYAGSVTGLYLLREMGQFFLELKAKRDDAFFRVLTISSADEATAVLRSAGLNENDFSVEAVSPAEVAKSLSEASIGISFRKPTFSQIAASPTKISEYLAAGLPVVSNAGTGDVDELLSAEQVGVTVNSLERASYQTAVERILELAADENIGSRCRQAALLNFDLISIGRARYREVYKRLEDA